MKLILLFVFIFFNLNLSFAAKKIFSTETLSERLNEIKNISEKQKFSKLIEQYKKDTPLHYAIWEKKGLETFQSLVKQGVDVNAQDIEGNTPLNLAAGRNDPKIFEFLVKEGADINVIDVEGKTLLHVASATNVLGIVQFLLHNGVDANVKDDKGKTPVHYAIWGKKGLETVKILVKEGADINAKDNIGYTPLHYAAYERNVRAVELLIANGVDINATDNEGRTAAHIAAEEGLKKILKILSKSPELDIVEFEKALEVFKKRHPIKHMNFVITSKIRNLFKPSTKTPVRTPVRVK